MTLISPNMPVRYSMIALSLIAVFLCYMDRVIISIAIIPMAADFGWNPEEQGRVLSSFFIGYLLTQVAGGWLAERFGGKIVLGGGVLFWSLFTLITPVAAAGGMVALIVTRILMGMGEGVSFPSIYTLFGRWIPAAERSRSIGLMYSMIPLGSIFALLATPWIVGQFGWEVAFYLFGSLGFIWWFFWQRMTTALPEQHPRITEAELADIRGYQSEGQSTGSPVSISALLRCAPVWAIIICHFCSNWGGYVLMAWTPTYINKGLGVDFSSVGLYAMVPPIASFFALNLGGWAADTAIRRGHDVTLVRKVLQTIGFGGSAVILAVVGYIQSPMLAIFLMSVGSFLGGAAACGFGVNHLDIAPKGAGIIMGLSNTAGTIPGVIGVYISGLILAATDSWALVFQTAAALYLFGLIIYLVFGSSKKLFD